MEERFGDEKDQIMFHLEAIENLPTIKRSDVVGLRNFYDDLKAHVQVLESLGPEVYVHVNDPCRMRIIVSKLPSDISKAWTVYKDNKNIDVDMLEFCEWLRKRVQILDQTQVI